MAKKVKKKKAASTVKKSTTKKKTIAGKTKKKGARSKVTKKSAKKTATKKTSVKSVKKTKKSAISPSRKATQSKTVKKKKISRRRRTQLSKTELNHFHGLLVEKLKEILGNVNHIELESLKKSRMDASGDLSSMPIHMADVGSDNYEQEFVLGLMDGERKIVQEILAALKRIEARTYGICEGTGELIPKARLEGIPWARYCVKYAEMVEKGLVSENDRPFADDNEYDEFDEETDVEEDSGDVSGYIYGEDDTDEEDEDDEPFYYHFSDDDDEIESED